MAGLDNFFRALVLNRMESLVLEPGEVVRLTKDGGEHRISKDPVPADLVHRWLEELAPGQRLPDADGPERTVSFRHRWEEVELAIAARWNGSGWSAVVTPANGTISTPSSGREDSAPVQPLQSDPAPPPAGSDPAPPPVESDPAPPPAGSDPAPPPVESEPAPPPVGSDPVPLAVESEPPPDPGRPARVVERIDEMLELMLARDASDLHLSAGVPPRMRISGDLQEVDGFAALEPERLERLLFAIAPERNREQFGQSNDTDFGYELGTGRARFRVNVFRDRLGVGAVLRQIPTSIPTFEELGLPEVLRGVARLFKGLVLVTGPTGSGKSTTMAALVDLVNRSRADHIITVEDPIEFVHRSRRCLVNQREVGVHTGSFRQALRAALREDPDVVLVGEMRDLETVSMAIETAETGHLVFGTLHTTTAASTVERLIEQFPADRQAQIRAMLAESLHSVVAQMLLKKIGGGRVAAFEVLIATPAVANLIREGKSFQ
ncbi:MAG: PilT/PilU family type 4a pilus ATPase, partial [Thermoanaerobaculia bacterium]|nr:PilT/PilU family type 4a pilus ATPase [Thermoanaerobaculia bacterium]